MDTMAFADDAPGTLVNTGGALAFDPDDLSPRIATNAKIHAGKPRHER